VVELFRCDGRCCPSRVFDVLVGGGFRNACDGLDIITDTGVTLPDFDTIVWATGRSPSTSRVCLLRVRLVSCSRLKRAGVLRGC